MPAAGPRRIRLTIAAALSTALLPAVGGLSGAAALTPDAGPAVLAAPAITAAPAAALPESETIFSALPDFRQSVQRRTMIEPTEYAASRVDLGAARTLLATSTAPAAGCCTRTRHRRAARPRWHHCRVRGHRGLRAGPRPAGRAPGAAHLRRHRHHRSERHPAPLHHAAGSARLGAQPALPPDVVRRARLLRPRRHRSPQLPAQRRAGLVARHRRAGAAAAAQRSTRSRSSR